eukprot:COSAG01_NODE_456_length_16789_cov_58.288556_2_plen_914_part_00
MGAEEAALDWLMGNFTARALEWPVLGATQLAELRAALRLLHTQGVFAAQPIPAPRVDSWNRRLQELCRSTTQDVRWVGACLIGATARSAHAVTFVASGAAWVSMLLPMLRESEPPTVTAMASTALTDVLGRCQHGAQPVRLDVTAALSRLMPVLASLRARPRHQQEALSATYAVLRACGAALRPFAPALEESCFSLLLSSGDDAVRQSAALCVGAIPGVVSTAKDEHADWLRVVRRLIGGLRDTLSAWVPEEEEEGAAGHSEGTTFSSGTGKDGTPSRGSGPAEDALFAVGRVHGLCVAVGAALHLPFAGMVQVPLGELVQIIDRVMSTSQVSLYGQEGTAAALPQFHAEMLRLLTAIISAVGRRLLPFANTIGDLLRVAISRSEKSLVGRSHVVRRAAYTAADICLQVLGPAVARSLVRPVLRPVLASLSQGMQITEDAVGAVAQFVEAAGAAQANAAVASPSPSSPSRKRRRDKRRQSGGGTTTDQGAVSVAMLSGMSQSDAALWTSASLLLRRIVETCGTAMDGGERLELDRAVVGWLKQHGSGGGSGGGAGRMLPAMASTETRQHLYATLLGSLACPIGAELNEADPTGVATGYREAEARVLPNLHPVARQLFVVGAATDPAAAVRSICFDGIRLCMLLAHPRAAPTHFAAPGTTLAHPVSGGSGDAGTASMGVGAAAERPAATQQPPQSQAWDRPTGLGPTSDNNDTASWGSLSVGAVAGAAVGGVSEGDGGGGSSSAADHTATHSLHQGGGDGAASQPSVVPAKPYGQPAHDVQLNRGVGEAPPLLPPPLKRQHVSAMTTGGSLVTARADGLIVTEHEDTAMDEEEEEEEKEEEVSPIEANSVEGVGLNSSLQSPVGPQTDADVGGRDDGGSSSDDAAIVDLPPGEEADGSGSGMSDGSSGEDDWGI